MRTVKKYRDNRNKKKNESILYDFPVSRYVEINNKLNEILTILRRIER